MNKKGSGIIASKSGFYILFLIIFAFSVTYAVTYVADNEIRIVDFSDLEKSVIINRVISCLSNGNFGEIDKDKFNEVNLKGCLNNDKFNILILLDDGWNNEIVSLGIPDANADSIRRYVLVDGEKTRLLVGYSKNVAT